MGGRGIPSNASSKDIGTIFVMVTMSWREAAIEALKGKGPLSADEVVQIISQESLRTISGLMPEVTVGSTLYSSIRDGDSRVRLAGRGLFEHTGSNALPVTTKTLSRLEEINPRDIWEDEARNFTPWLFENAEYLGEVLGIDIELESKEYPVGAFSLDLFGRDLTNECVLIVENQLADTDHKHLGQLLTYAAGTDAATIVWVAPNFRDEHRQALEFLNHKSGENARFFGVEVSVVRIGDSAPAPMFNLIAKPSEWREKVAASQNTGEISQRRELYRSFWTKYLDAVHQSHPGLTNVRSPSTRNWTSVNYLKKGINISMAFLSKRQVVCEIYIDLWSGERNSQVLSALLEHKEEVEKAVGEVLHWDDIPMKRACRIRAITEGDVGEASDHVRLIEWMLDHQIKMKSVLKPLIEGLPNALWLQQDEDEESTSIEE